VDVDTVAVHGKWIRHAHRSSLLGRAGEPTDGRWQRGEIVRGLYLADEPATAIAEWYRLLAERGLPPARAIPHDHHVWEVELQLATSALPSVWRGLTLQSPSLDGEHGHRFRRLASSCSATASLGSSPPAQPVHKR
jgi:hypothetical protein